MMGRFMEFVLFALCIFIFTQGKTIQYEWYHGIIYALKICSSLITPLFTYFISFILMEFFRKNLEENSKKNHRILNL